MALGTDLISHYVLDSDLTDGVGSNDLSGSGGAFVAAKLSNGYDNQATANISDESWAGVETDPTAIEITVDMWLNIQTAPDGTEFFMHFRPVALTNSAGTMWFLWDVVNKRFQFTFYDQSVSQSVYSPVYGSVPTSTWIHAFLWFDQSEFGLLIDNDNESSLPHNGMPSGTIIDWDLYLWNNSGGAVANRIDAILDNIGIWERKLTQAERDTRYNAGNGLAYPFPTPGKSTVLIL